MMTTMTT